MRPFFSYYGAKWTGAKHYGPPRHDLVIEPFAGSASYATRWDCRNVKLYDVSQDICDLWAWLIGCSAEDVARIPWEQAQDRDDEFSGDPVFLSVLASSSALADRILAVLPSLAQAQGDRGGRDVYAILELSEQIARANEDRNSTVTIQKWAAEKLLGMVQ